MVEPVRHRRTKGAETDMFEPKATASHLDSTQSVSLRGARPCLALGVKPTCRLNARTSQFDPKGTFRRVDTYAFQHDRALDNSTAAFVSLCHSKSHSGIRAAARVPVSLVQA